MGDERQPASVDGPLELSLRAFPSTLRGVGGREIPFTRALLTLRNVGAAPIAGLQLHGTLTREEGPPRDLSGRLVKDSLEPGEAIEWDVYDLLLAADPAVASQVHLWGHKAVLKWEFRLSAWFEFRGPDGARSVRTRPLERAFAWSPAGTGDGVELTLGPST